MWSRALHVTVGRYPMGSWHIAVLETEYRRGIPRDRELLVDVVATQDEVHARVHQALDTLMRLELADRLGEHPAVTPVQ